MAFSTDVFASGQLKLVACVNSASADSLLAAQFPFSIVDVVFSQSKLPVCANELAAIKEIPINVCFNFRALRLKKFQRQSELLLAI